jgi:hypothetical protein
LENLKASDHLEDLDVDERIIVEWILKKQILRIWTEFLSCRIQSNSGLL